MDSRASSSSQSGSTLLRSSLLETRVARRMLGLFLLCALLPSGVLTVIAYRHVAGQLNQQSRERLREASKTLGMTLISRLQLCDAELAAAAREAVVSGTSRSAVLKAGLSRLDGLMLSRDGEPSGVWGKFTAPVPRLDRKQLDHLAAGRSVLLVVWNGEHPDLLMGRSLVLNHPEQSVLWGEVRLATLWADLLEENSDKRLDVAVNRKSLVALGGSETTSPTPPELLLLQGRGDLEWSRDDATHLAGYWTAFLGYEYAAPSWTVTLSEPIEQMLAPMRDFTRTFILLVGIALVLVFLLSNSQIRRRMRPLVVLQRATQHVAEGEFGYRAQLQTGDEFEVLASSFNSMASRLGEQFSALSVANQRLEHLSWGTLAALARTIDASSPWTAGHSERVTQISLALGEELGLGPEDLDRLHRGGLLHDIGKIGIPHELLDRPGKLTRDEMTVVQSHSATGARILEPLAVFSDIIPIVRHHHERFDGSGYPDRLEGTRIPYLARIVAVADVYDAVVSDRPYRLGWTSEEALKMIQDRAGVHHDPDLVVAFTALHRRGGLRQLAKLPSTVKDTQAFAAPVGGGVG